jgi:PEP-CTERM motif
MKIGVLAVLAILAVPAIVLADGDPQYNYPELGGVDQQTKFYDNGAIITHPSGTQYVRQGGNWVIYNPPAVALPEPASWILMGAGIVAAGWWGRRRKHG